MSVNFYVAVEDSLLKFAIIVAKTNDVILDFIDHYYNHLGITPIKRLSVRDVDNLDDLINNQSIIDEIFNFALKIR